MTAIQLILISGFLFTGLFYFVRLRNRIADLLLLFTIVLAAVVCVLFPEWTNVLAHKLGVGRGADMVFYLFILLFYFILLKLYARMRKLEEQLTILIRNDALRNAVDQKPSESI
jgi:small membrane protein